MSNDRQFEDLIRQTLEDFEVDYNPAHWKEMESQLNLLGHGVAVSMNTFYSAFLAAGVFMAGLIYFGMPDDQTGAARQTEILVEEEIQPAVSDGSRIVERVDNDPKQDLETFVIEVPETAVESLYHTDEKPTAESADEKLKTPNTDQSNLVQYDEMKVKKIRSNVSQGCQGSPITFTTAGNEADGNFLWNFGDGYFSNDPNPVHVFDAPGIFHISLLVTPLTGGKLTPMTIEDQIRINPRPKASFDFTYKNNKLDIPQVMFENHSKNVDQVLWVVDGNVISEENSTAHNFTRKGTYDVKLVAINEFGCTDTTARKVVIKDDYNLMAPTSFTPDGDGREDTFMPRALRLIEGSFILRVKDPRTDMVIFESNNVNHPWDGTIQGTSVKASAGDYEWETEISNNDGTNGVFNGTVKLKK